MNYFSVVIPALNEEKYLPRLLGDLSRQTFRDFGVIVVDGRSDDGTVSEAKKFKNALPKLTILKSERRNVSVQRNLGVKKATGEWIVFIDADNRLPRYFLQGLKFQLEKFEPDILTCFLDAESKNKADNAIVNVINLYFIIQSRTSRPQCLESMLVFKKEKFGLLNGFNEMIPIGEGAEILYRAKKLKMIFKIVEEPKYTYSLRRLRKVGVLNMARAIVKNEMYRLLDISFPPEEAAVLYPMKGGRFFTYNDQNTSIIEKAIVELRKIPQIPKSLKSFIGMNYDKKSLSRLLNYLKQR